MKMIRVLFILIFISSSAQAETIIGRWCDRAVPNFNQFNNVITIKIDDENATVLVQNFADGSSTSSVLRESSGAVYEIVSSATNERFRIVPNNGELQLLDNNGLIRTAERLENTVMPGECF